MGILTDFFVASKKEAAAAAVRRAPKGAAVLRLKNIDPVKIAELAEALALPGSNDPVAWIDKGLRLVSGGDEGPWVHELGEALVKALAELEDREIRRVGLAWSKAETCAAEGYSAATCAEVITGLRGLARQARDRKKMLLVWMCL